MSKKQKLKKHLKDEMIRLEKIISDYENDKTDNKKEMKLAQAKLESLVEVMDIMNWDLK